MVAVAVRPLQTAAFLTVAVQVQVVVHRGIRLVLQLVVVTVLVLRGLIPGLLQVAVVQTRLLPAGLQLAVQALGTRLAVAAVLAIQTALQHLLETNIAALVVQVVTVAS